MKRKNIIDHTVDPQEKAVLSFEYRMRMDYEDPVNKAYYTIKALPGDNQRQKVRSLCIEILPEEGYSKNIDGFGNRLVYGSINQPHKVFEYRVSGSVEIGQILFEEYATQEEAILYRNPHGLNRPGQGLMSYFGKISCDLEENDYVNAICLMRRLHQDFAYEQGVTKITTDGESAWKLGRGVCQDYAHIFIALCHLAGIPARYVAGVIAGEGESHAWAEILYRGKWIGMDPTNGILISRSHVKFGHGRDAMDCQLNRGIIYGGGKQSQSICVTVNEEKDG